MALEQLLEPVQDNRVVVGENQSDSHRVPLQRQYHFDARSGV
jgi:hypothetical protein